MAAGARAHSVSPSGPAAGVRASAAAVPGRAGAAAAPAAAALPGGPAAALRQAQEAAAAARAKASEAAKQREDAMMALAVSRAGRVRIAGSAPPPYTLQAHGPHVLAHQRKLADGMHVCWPTVSSGQAGR